MRVVENKLKSNQKLDQSNLKIFVKRFANHLQINATINYTSYLFYISEEIV